jgi:hypothetical protein
MLFRCPQSDPLLPDASGRYWKRMIQYFRKEDSYWARGQLNLNSKVSIELSTGVYASRGLLPAFDLSVYRDERAVQCDLCQ